MLRRFILLSLCVSLSTTAFSNATDTANQTPTEDVAQTVTNSLATPATTVNNSTTTPNTISQNGNENTTSSVSIHQELKKRFIEGGPLFMGIVLLCLIFGLSIAIERILFLNLSTTNTRKLNKELDQIFSSGSIEAAKEVCNNTRGAIARLYQESLTRYEKEGIEATEKALVGHGAVQMGLLERNLSWISL